MKVSFNDQIIEAMDLKFGFKETLKNALVTRIISDPELKEEIEVFCVDTGEDVELKVYDIADTAISKLKIYCDFDVTVEVK